MADDRARRLWTDRSAGFKPLERTHHMPEGRWPEGYGIEGHPIPHGYWAQFLYQFRRERSTPVAVPPAAESSPNQTI